MRELQLSLTEPQAAFATAAERFPAIVAGFGSGKTEALCTRLLIQKMLSPASVVGYYAPTYDLVSRVGWTRIEEMLEQHGLSYKTNKVEKVIRVKGYGEFLFRTMENPSALVGYEHADAGVDELDTLKAAHADLAWKKIIARNRQKKPYGIVNSVAVATTPEGFRFVYDRWAKNAAKAELDGYKLYRASTYSNLHNLPPDYIDNLANDYPPQLLQAYIEGLFVNLTSGSVYPNFSRAANSTKEVARAGESLHIGMDFNVYKMAAVVFVIRDGAPLAVGEFTKVRDTPAMIEAIKTRYGGTHKSITIYPDASGQNTSSKSASVSDILLLRQAGFGVDALSQNPPIKDRVAAVNGLILNAAGQRRLRVNVDQCPVFTECLEQQVYDDHGDPDKKAGKDHLNDAAGYFLYRRWPVGRNAAQILQIVGS